MTKRVWIVLAVAAAMAGCSENDSRPRLTSDVGSSRTFASGSVDQAFDAAKVVLAGKYRIADVDSTQGEIRTEPQQYSSRESTGQLSDSLMRSKKTLRRIVTVRVSSTATGKAIAYAQVEIQRQDTHVMRAFADQRSASDLPSDADTTMQTMGSAEQREAWTVIRRDRAEEQRILADIAAMLQPAAPAEAAPVAAPVAEPAKAEPVAAPAKEEPKVESTSETPAATAPAAEAVKAEPAASAPATTAPVK